MNVLDIAPLVGGVVAGVVAWNVTRLPAWHGKGPGRHRAGDQPRTPGPIKVHTAPLGTSLYDTDAWRLIGTTDEANITFSLDEVSPGAFDLLTGGTVTSTSSPWTVPA